MVVEENLGQGSNERVGKLHEAEPRMATGGAVAGSHIEAPGALGNEDARPAARMTAGAQTSRHDRTANRK
jgi:hypothetical protein